MIEIRPHHLLCLLTYIGEGYSSSFVGNFDRLRPRIMAGEALRVTYQPDSICQPRLTDLADCHHCYEQRIRVRDELAVHDLAGLGLVLNEGQIIQLTAERIHQLQLAFRSGLIRQACQGCQWFQLCSQVIAQKVLDQD